MQQLKKQQVHEGKTAEFEVEVDCGSPFTVSWFKGTRELPSNNKYQQLKEGSRYSLSVRDCFGEDADEYSCRVTTKAGSRSSRAPLVIKCKNVFRILLPSLLCE